MLKNICLIGFFTFSALSLISCKSSKINNGTYANKFLDTTWTLTYISGSRIAFEGLFPRRKPFITFESEKNHVSGFAGCNNFMGPVFANKDSLRFGNLASTMMACVEGAQGERNFLSLLPTTETYKVDADTLWISAKNVPIMKFVRGKQ